MKYLILMGFINPCFIFFSQEELLTVKKDSLAVVYEKVNNNLLYIDSIIKKINSEIILYEKLKSYDTIYYYNPNSSKSLNEGFKNYEGFIKNISISWFDSLQVDEKSLFREPWYNPKLYNILNNCIIMDIVK